MLSGSLTGSFALIQWAGFQIPHSHLDFGASTRMPCLSRLKSANAMTALNAGHGQRSCTINFSTVPHCLSSFLCAVADLEGVCRHSGAMGGGAGDETP